MSGLNQNKKLVMCGCHEGGALAVRALIEAGYAFDHFVCLTPEQAEKHAISGYYDYRPLAEKHNIPVYSPRAYTLDHPEDQRFFSEHRFDLLVQGGWQRLFPENVLETLSVGALGLHGSADRLPKVRGRSPMNWSLIEGKERFLMHLFMIKPGVDDGDVLGVLPFDINAHDDIRTLYYKYAISYRELLLAYLPDILAGTAQVQSQIGEPSYYPKRSPEDGRIDWETMDLTQIYNFIRAQTKPYPGAFGTIGGRDIRIWKARPFDTRLDAHTPSAPYGSVVEEFDGVLIIRCRGGLLLLDEWEEIV